jgi:soluble lytic murein transglycosylase-like protein
MKWAQTVGLAASVWLLWPGAGVRGEIYMYRDGKGTLHFSNAPSSPGFTRYAPAFGGVVRGRGMYVNRARYRAFDSIIHDASRRHGVEKALVKAVIRAESDFVPHARSPKGALGLMQLMPATARLHSVWRVFEPRDNIEGGVKHLRMLLDRYSGNVRLALAAYNAGIESVARYGGVPPFPETVEYLERVLRFRRQFLGER